MSHLRSPAISRDQPAVYQIELQGVLDPTWLEAADHLEVIVTDNGFTAPITTLTGCLADQAALAGLLSLALTLGLPVLSVLCLGRAR